MSFSASSAPNSAGLDYATALFACAPGGMTDMALIAQDLGANSAYVSIIQLSRMLFIVSVFPFIFRRRFKKSIADNAGSANQQNVLNASAPNVKDKIIRFSLTLLLALAGGLLLKLVSFPAGMMVGAMIGTAALNITTGRAYAPKFMLDVVQALAGTYVGAGITMAMLLSMSDIIIPIICVILEVFVLSFTATFILSRVAKLPKSTCMLSGTPGGLQVISLLSEEFGFDTPSIIVMQTARLVAVISIFPLLLRFVTNLLS